jgi:hypothetical protein
LPTWPSASASFEFNWAYLVGLLCFVTSAWLTQGPSFVLIVIAVAGVLIGVYYVVWRWLRSRSA